MPADTWLHRDAGLAVSVEWAHSRALLGDWTSGTPAQRIDQLRALVAETAAAIGYYAGTIRTVQREGGAVCLIDVRPQPGTPAERLGVAGRLYETWRVLQVTDDGGAENGLETQAQPDTAALLPAVAVVAIAVAGAVALGYCANQAAALIDRHLARTEQSRRLMQVHVTALKAVEQHQAREEQSGTSLPLDAATKTVLESLKSAQQAVVERREEPFPSFWPSGSSGSVGKVLEALPWIVGGLVVAWFATER
jgi:hypothetical protein